MHGFALSAAVAGEGFVERFRLLAAFSHLSRAAKKQEGEGEETSETQGGKDYADAPPPVKESAPSCAHYIRAGAGQSCALVPRPHRTTHSKTGTLLCNV